MKRMRAFARFENEIWCVDLAYVDKLAKENNGVKDLLVLQDLFDRTVNAKVMKTKDSQETVKVFSSMLTKRTRPKKFRLTRVPILRERLKILLLQSGYSLFTQFINTLNSRWNSSIDMRPKTVKNCDFMSIPYSKPIRDYKKPTIKTGDRVRIAQYDLPFSKGYKPQFTREVFENVAIATRKPPTYTIRIERDEIIQGRFHQKEPIKVT